MAEDTNNTNTQETNPAPQTQNSPVDEKALFDKLDGILEKRIDGLTKSILKENGLVDDDLKDTLTKYNAHKQSKTNEASEEITRLKSENDALKSEKTQTAITNAAFTQALELGIDKAKIPHVLKLADFSKAVNEKGEISGDTVKTALEAVLKDVPEFKSSAAASKGFKLGADTKNNNASDGADAELRRAFGLK